MVLSFLNEYDFIQIKDLKVKIKPSILEFLNEIQRIEKEDMLRH
jgi:hypothetical protein